jgi:ribosomal protein S18 acetylase RimI-like enzyme
MEIEEIKMEELHLIKEHWEELNRIHLEDSIHFKDHFSKFSFEKRIESLSEIDRDDIFITHLKVDGIISGYCISTLKSGRGEIESIYIKPEQQGQGFGEELIGKHIQWLKRKGANIIRVSVSHGHESVLGFYEKLGFFRRMSVLEYKDRNHTEGNELP